VAGDHAGEFWDILKDFALERARTIRCAGLLMQARIPRMSYWAVVQTQTLRERLAQDHLKFAGFESYLPRVSTWRRNYGRKIKTVVPLFPCYLFLLVRLQWTAVCACPGVLRLVMAGAQPARLPDGVIEEIKRRERDGLINLPKRTLVPGDRVHITDGPFRGHLAIFADMSGSERVAVLLHVLGSLQRVTLPAANIEAAG
jgi:transcriptional antiterminator RfaH